MSTKKLYPSLLSFFFISILSNAQSQRLVLLEDFSNASNDPCFAANISNYNALVAANPTKVVRITYHPGFPGTDIMFDQDSMEIKNRGNYYSNTSVPFGKIDGTVNFNPQSIVQATIDSAYAFTCPFSINISHSFNTLADSVFVTATITCTQNVTMTNPVFHCAMLEKFISFNYAPGSSGETDFYSAFRKFYPDTNGTSLSATWTNGQTQTITFAEKVPSYIYSKAEIIFAGWIQDNATKYVYQSGKSTPAPFTTDLGTDTVAGIAFASCNTSSFTPVATIKNYGSTTITTTTLNFMIDNNIPQTQIWNGTLLPNATTTVTLPLQTAIQGAHTFTVFTTFPNGIGDINNVNDKDITHFATISASPVPPPFTESFAGSFPPNNFIVQNTDALSTWEKDTTVGGFGNSSESAAFYFYSYPIYRGEKDYLYLPPIDLFSAPSPQYLEFSVAYAYYSILYHDSLKVDISTDCGINWNTIYSKGKNTLATAGNQPQFWAPDSTEWRKEGIDLTPYIGNAVVLLRYHSINGYGNNLYIDDINIHTSGVGINELNSDNNFSLYPNPSNGVVSVEANIGGELKICNALGQEIFSYKLQTTNYKLNLQDLPSGIYFYQFISEGELINTGKLVIE